MVTLKEELMRVNCINFLNQYVGDRTIYADIASAVAMVAMNGPTQWSVRITRSSAYTIKIIFTHSSGSWAAGTGAQH